MTRNPSAVMTRDEKEELRANIKSQKGLIKVLKADLKHAEISLAKLTKQLLGAKK